jgi:hypothetical protein
MRNVILAVMVAIIERLRDVQFCLFRCAQRACIRTTPGLALVLCFLLVGSGGISYGQNNPQQNVPGDLFYRINNQNFAEPLMLASYWNPAWQGWDGHSTSAGTKINHVHVTSTFPYTDSQNRQITAVEVDAFWDNKYAGYTKVSGTDPTQNCYGYATSHGIWINAVGPVLQDEYAADQTVKAVIQNIPAQDHMIKVFPIWYCLLADRKEYLNVSKTSEKNRDSGVYEKEPVGHPYLGPLPGNTYRKK